MKVSAETPFWSVARLSLFYFRKMVGSSFNFDTLNCVCSTALLVASWKIWLKATIIKNSYHQMISSVRSDGDGTGRRIQSIVHKYFESIVYIYLLACQKRQLVNGSQRTDVITTELFSVITKSHPTTTRGRKAQSERERERERDWRPAKTNKREAK